MSYKIVKITSFYKDFLSQLYRNNKDLKTLSYSEQYRFLMNQKYAWSDFFKTHIEKQGSEVIEIIHNAEDLQLAWQKEYQRDKKNNILIEQIEYYKPEILFFQDIKSFSGAFINHLRSSYPFIKLIFGHNCSPYSKLDLENYKTYDFIITCLDSFKNHFERNGIKSFRVDHGFESSILKHVQNDNHFPSNEFIFIGSFIGGEDFHNNRLQYIERLLKENINITIYGNAPIDSTSKLLAKQFAFVSSKFLNIIGFNSINQNIGALKKVSTLKYMPRRTNMSKPLKQSIINETYYGINMYKLLAKANIALNIQAGVAGDYAVNMRLFETTGVGTLLLTDYKSNIRDFFEPDYEIIIYKSIEECIDKSKWLLDNPHKAKEIALAGQKRTLKDHTLEDRFQKIYRIIKNHL